MAFTLGKFDESKQEQGVWVEFGGSEFLIAYTGTKFTKTLNRLRKPYEKQIAKGTLDPDTQNKIYYKALAENVLLDWKGVKDFEGNDVGYTKEIAIEALSSDPEFFGFVTETSTDIGNYEKEAVQTKAKK